MNRRNRKTKEKPFFDDYKTRLAATNFTPFFSWWFRLPKFHKTALMILSPFVLLLLLLPSSTNLSTTSEQVEIAKEPTRVEVKVNTTSLSEVGESKKIPTKTDAWQEYKVQSGDTLAKVFRANNLAMADLNALVAIEGLDQPLSRITEGQLIRFKLTSDGLLDILQLEKQGSAVMFFRLSDGGFGRSK